MPKKFESEVGRRVREKAENQKDDAERERRHRENRDDLDRIVGAINAIKSQAEAYKKDHDGKWTRERCWQAAEIGALVLAAVVGIAAIIVSSWDASKQVVATQRAWIKITNVDVLDPGVVIDKTGAFIQLTLTVKNTGNSPALKGTWHLSLIPGPGGTGWDKPWIHLVDKCAEIRNAPAKGGFTIFPNEEFPTEGGSISAGARAEAGEIANVLNRGQPYPNAFDLRVTGCFDYTFSTDPNGHHQTAFTLPLLRKVALAPGDLPPFDFTMTMGTIPPKNITAGRSNLTASAD